jgi:hypothetical protein
MNPMNGLTLLEETRDRVRLLAARYALDDAEVTVLAKPLTAEEAIGKPGRRDFPILEGKERVIEAKILGSRGQAFTDSPSDFAGRFRDVLELSLTTNRNRAVFLASVNAALCHLGVVKGTVHCKDEAPEECASEIAASARRTGSRSVGLIGFNPAVAEALVREFGPEHVQISDLNPQLRGTSRFGIPLMDGRNQTSELIRACDLVLVTGTTLVNGTFDEILTLTQAFGKRIVLFGITGASVCSLMNLERWCPKAQQGIPC